MSTRKPPRISPISRSRLLDLYAVLLRCRMTEDLAGGSRKKTAARAAAAAAVAIELERGDTVAAAANEPVLALMKIAATQAVVLTFDARPAGKRSSPAAALKAALETSRAYAREKKKGKRHSVAAIFGAGALVASNAWRNAMRVAGEERLPILFVAHSGAAQAFSRFSAQRAFPAIPVDRGDVVALYRVASEALTHARRGNGPTLIECVRWPSALPKNGSGAVRDPVLNLEHYLKEKGIGFEQRKRKTIAGFHSRTREARSS